MNPVITDHYLAHLIEEAKSGRLVLNRELFLDVCLELQAARRGHTVYAHPKPYAHLDREKVEEIRALKREGMKQADIAKRFGITSALVSNIVLNKTWKDGKDGRGHQKNNPSRTE
jgi:hypothetical protein